MNELTVLYFKNKPVKCSLVLLVFVECRVGHRAHVGTRRGPVASWNVPYRVRKTGVDRSFCINVRSQPCKAPEVPAHGY